MEQASQIPKLSMKFSSPSSSSSSSSDLDENAVILTPRKLILEPSQLSRHVFGQYTPQVHEISNFLPYCPTTPILTSPLKPKLLPSSSFSSKSGVISAYAVNTHCGIVRNYNEDRVNITLHLPKPFHRQRETWPPCFYFGLFDGHGGKGCSNFLRDNLHLYITDEPTFPSNPKAALINAFHKADQDFLANAEETRDRSGSCALIVLFVGNDCYIANTGDSRAIMSSGIGRDVYSLSTDHKPNSESETRRIKSAGGSVYFAHVKNNKNLGCYRVLPSRLAVSRSFGDFHSKKGNPWVIIPTPEITKITITQKHEFLVMASDGIFDRLENNEVIDLVWKVANTRFGSLQNICGIAVQKIMKKAFERYSTDNVTVIIIAFEHMSNKIMKK